MIKLRQLLESSTRDRLKKRVRDRPQFQLTHYLKRVARLHELNAKEFENRYHWFYFRCFSRPLEQRSRFAEVITLFSLIDIGNGRQTFFDSSRNTSTRQIKDTEEADMRKLLESMDVPEKFDLKTTAILLRFLDEHGFILHGI